MHLINEIKVVRLPSRTGGTVEGHERIVGVDARWSGRGVVFERHVPVEVVATTNGAPEVFPMQNHGAMQRLMPYLAAPLLAIIVKQLFRARG